METFETTVSKSDKKTLELLVKQTGRSQSYIVKEIIRIGVPMVMADIKAGRVVPAK